LISLIPDASQRAGLEAQTTSSWLVNSAKHFQWNGCFPHWLTLLLHNLLQPLGKVRLTLQP